MEKRNYQFLTLLFVSFFAILVVRNAWTSDDAYITFRSIENFLAGYGPVFNPTLRVQSFTHPLWMFLTAGVYYLSYHLHLTFGNGPVFPTMFVSILFSSSAVYLAMNKIMRRELVPLLLFIGPVTLSRAFIDFSTSGLENPLTDLLLVLFLWKFFSDRQDFFFLALIASLIALTRIDALLLVGPALLYCFWTQRVNWGKNLIALVVGFLPFLLWELFSFFYYGFLFPNTAYAKLNTGISGVLLFMQGLDYVLNSINWDPLTLFVITLAGVITFLEQDKRGISIYAGILLYFAYTVRIGGDFMSGRYFAASLLMSAILISRFQRIAPKYALAGLATILALGVFSFRSTLLDPLEPLISGNYYEVIDKNRIADERLAYFDRNRDEGLVVLGFRDLEETSPYTAGNWKFKKVTGIDLVTSLGKAGYVKGPNVLFVDKSALTDPLLARLPVEDRVHWRIGHFLRKVPAGYLDTLLTGTNQIVDPNLAQYYDKLSFVISGPLWSWNRLIEIWKLNTGQYNYLLNAYISTLNP